MLQKRSPTSYGNQSGRRFRRLRALFARIRDFIPGAFPIFLFFLFIFLVYNLFAIRKIECVLNGAPCPAEVTDKLNKFIGTNVLLINQKELTLSMKDSFPIEKISIGFKVFNTLKIKLEGRLASLKVQVALVQTLPVIGLDQVTVSTESAVFALPSEEISRSLQTVDFVSFDIWDNGQMAPSASAESKIKYLFTEKPDAEMVGSVYKLVKIVEKYLETEEILILGRRVFLSQLNQPDIIVNVPFDEDTLIQALQSFTYLTTIKKDAKVIDLRFKNPILR